MVSSASFSQIALFAFACLLAILAVQADSINEPKEAAMFVPSDEMPFEKRFGAQQRFAFAKRRAFAFAKRAAFGDNDFGGRAFAFAKRASGEPFNDADEQIGAEKRFAFADSGARRFAFAKRGQWGGSRQFAFAR